MSKLDHSCKRLLTTAKKLRTEAGAFAWQTNDTRARNAYNFADAAIDHIKRAQVELRGSVRAAQRRKEIADEHCAIARAYVRRGAGQMGAAKRHLRGGIR